MEIKLYCDLHTHTEYSDGIYTPPKQIIALAVSNGINVLAITDHDNILGYFEAKAENEDYHNWPITLIPGVELTTSDYHLLGLNFNPYNVGLGYFIEHSKQIQRNKCEKRIERLNDNGIPITMGHLDIMFPNARFGKYNLYMAMISSVPCRRVIYEQTPGMNFYERYNHYFGKPGIIGKIEDQGIDSTESINAIHEAGGIIGIAHPHKDIKEMYEMDILLGLGIDFIEVQPHYKGKETGRYKIEEFEQYAKEHGLALTYGSDYHGPTFNRPLLSQGENVISKKLEERLNSGYVNIGYVEFHEPFP